MTSPERRREATTWLDAFAAAVASQDFVAGKQLFLPSVTAYGTREPMMWGLEELVTAQWTPVWTSTTGFRFSAIDWVSDLGDGLAVAARWESFSRGSGSRRTGRCSLVLCGSPLLCAHSHFSMTPSGGCG